MQTKIIEVTNGPCNWGKFLVGKFDDQEWAYLSVIDPFKAPLLKSRGWSSAHLHVLDIETGEGGLFRLGGSAKADLDKHRIWVCPLFEPFLAWLYQQQSPWDALPAHLDLPDEPGGLCGYRRPGPATTTALFYTLDHVVLCRDHLDAAFKVMIPPYVRRSVFPGTGVVAVDRVSALRLRCEMCHTIATPGRRCKRCKTALHPQWPMATCSKECAGKAQQNTTARLRSV